jgi:hypothetical protein
MPETDNVRPLTPYTLAYADIEEFGYTIEQPDHPVS